MYQNTNEKIKCHCNNKASLNKYLYAKLITAPITDNPGPQNPLEIIRSIRETTTALCCSLAIVSCPALADSIDDPGMSVFHSTSIDKSAYKQSARFLMQSTLGFNRHELEHLNNTGIEPWIAEQLSAKPTKLEPHIEFLASFGERDVSTASYDLPYHKVMSMGNTVGYLNFSTSWLRAVLRGNDLLRQRIAWALSQILVVSNRTNLLTEASANYYDMLLDGAFGQYEDLLLNATYHPVMGRYLTYMGNTKANEARNIVPDENYARELMQLFTIGLWQLDDNGNQKRDTNGEPVATYTNEDIRSIASILTGFWLDKTRFGKIDWNRFDEPMVVHRKYHDRQDKTALNGYITVSAGTEPDAEIRYLIKSLANHPNTAPFISRKLIQHLVTSNPTPDYIKRVVKVWRASSGNLGKVVTAILLDPDARGKTVRVSVAPTKLKEPIVRVVSLIKLLGCGHQLGKQATDYPGLQWWYPYLEYELNQEPLGANSVFSFFNSAYANPGAIADKNLVSPEFDLMDAVSTARFTNYVWQGLNDGFHRHPQNPKFEALTCDLAWEQALLNHDMHAFVNYLDVMLAAGNMSESTRQVIQTQIGRASISLDKVRAALLGVVVSPEGAVLQ